MSEPRWTHRRPERAPAALSARAGVRGPFEATARSLAAVLALVWLLAGCSGGLGQQGDAGQGGDQKGYVSGDGTVTVLAAAERGDPVALTGTTTTADALDTTAWRGDVVVVNLWYAGCAPCRAEAPDLAAAATANTGAGVRFVGINVRDDTGTAAAFERTYAVPYPSILDAERGANVLALAGLVSPQAIPTTVILDRAGRPAARVLGQVDPGILQTLIDDALAETDPDTSTGTAAPAAPAAPPAQEPGQEPRQDPAQGRGQA